MNNSSIKFIIIFLFLGNIVLAEGITETDWVNNKEIKEVRAIYQSIKKCIVNKNFK